MIDNETQHEIRNYLLGSLGEEERDELEQRFFSDEGLFEQVEMGKDELIEEYLQGTLGEAERKQFESHFLAGSGGKQEIKTHRAIRDFLSQGGAGEGESEALPFFAARRAWPMWAMAAGISVIAIGGGAWIAAQARQQTDQAAAEAARSREQVRELSDKLGREQSITSSLKTQLAAKSQQMTTAATKKPALVLSFVLTPGILRGSETTRNLAIPVDAVSVHFKLAMPDATPRNRARVTLSKDNLETWSEDLKPSSSTRDSISVTIPARVLGAGDYLLSLGEVSSTGGIEPIEDYAFRVTITRRRGSE